MVVIGRFGAFFGRRRLVADADTGWSSAARTDATGCSAHGEASALVKLAVWSAVVPQRVRAIGHCLQQRSMRTQATAHYLRSLLAVAELAG